MATSFDYSRQAQTYDMTRAASPSVLRPLVRALSAVPLGTLVDLGGGTGNYAQALGDAGWQTTVVDRSGDMLSRAGQKGLPVCRADIADLPLPDRSVDVALIVSMLHHVPDWTTALAEARRVVRPGGIVVLMGYTRSHMAADIVGKYFPTALAHFTRTHQTRDELLAELPGAEESPVFYEDLLDGSMAALGRQPELILDPDRRRQTSFIEWVSHHHPEELRTGLAQLEHDLTTGVHPQDANAESRAERSATPRCSPGPGQGRTERGITARRVDATSIAPRGDPMKAAVYYETGAPEVLRYEDVPDPELQPGGVLIEVAAISIEGGDTLNRLGGDMPATPHIVGYQCAGTIAAVADDVTDRAVGQQVVASMMHGSHAELVAVPPGSTWLVPDGFDLTKAACMPIAFGTADDCLFEFGRLQAGETVLVQAGAGGVGIAAIQLAKRAGATVLATASSTDKLDRLAKFGLDHGINYRKEDFAEVTRQLTDGRGVDLVLDSVGSTLAGSIRSLAYRGRISYVGNAGRDQQPVDISALMGGSQCIQGVFLGAELFSGPRAYDNIGRLIGLAADGELEVVVDRTFPLAEAAAAHAHLEDRKAFGRVVLVP